MRVTGQLTSNQALFLVASSSPIYLSPSDPGRGSKTHLGDLWFVGFAAISPLACIFLHLMIWSHLKYGQVYT